jgi:SAM-dependent methyltransferase
VLDLAGDVRGLRVLDLGCGAGHLAAELVDRGAQVVGVDGSARLLRHAGTRLGDGVELHRHDLEEPLRFAGDASFDGVVAALALHHLDARAQLLAEVVRVLRPGGWFVVSTHHPTADRRRVGGSYLAHERAALPLASGRFAVPAWRMPLQDLLGELTAPGLVLDRLVEPRPRPELAATEPETYERLCSEPAFIALRLRRAKAGSGRRERVVDGLQPDPVGAQDHRVDPVLDAPVVRVRGPLHQHQVALGDQ